MSGRPDTRPSPAAGSPVASTYRCFLFADLRGYTAFIERAGNAAAVELLDVYMAILRTAVAGHEGAEIKVEGDGFHAVFLSASSAIQCAVEITNAAARANESRPERPINVGVGIHAGEAVETGDGFIGSAVNIAARVCAAAAAGEVLVTGTVRGIAQASVELDFAPRGRRRLKGIPEPVDLYAVVARGTVAPRRRVEWRWLAGGVAVLALVVLGGAAIVAANLGSSTADLPASVGQLALGRYAAREFTPPLELAIDEPGWAVYRNAPEAIGLYHDGDPRGWLDIGRVERVYTAPCASDGPSISAGESASDLIGALESVPFLELATPASVEIGGHPGMSVDVDVDAGAMAACGSLGGAGIALLDLHVDDWEAAPGERFHLVAIDASGGTVSFLQSIETSPEGAVIAPAFEQFIELSDRVIHSAAF
jgi:class 3 adenylate cyclase